MSFAFIQRYTSIESKAVSMARIDPEIIFALTSMYTKHETSKQKQSFWTAFGRYMKPVLSADYEEVNWINYKTGNKHLSFKMDVGTKKATIAIVIDHPDAATRQAY